MIGLADSFYCACGCRLQYGFCPACADEEIEERPVRLPNANMYGMTYAQLKCHAAAQMRERAKERKIAAAKRALSILNKFPPGEFRARHASRIFRNLNKLRAA